MAVVGEEYANVSTTLFVGNIPYTTNEKELENAFSEVGPIRRCFIVKDKGVGYVTFALREDAELAIKKVKKIGGRNINSKFARKRSETTTSPKIVPDNEVDTKAEPKIKDKKKAVANQKKAKLIIRNLSFKADEETVKKEFEKFGNVVEVTIPKKTDGKMRGFCFVQYKKVSSANSAKQKMNGKDFLGRPIAVDWSMAKKKYLEVKSEEKTELLDHDSSKSSDGDDISQDGANETLVAEPKIVKEKKRKNMFSSKDGDEDVEDYVQSDDSDVEKEEDEEESKSSISEAEEEEDQSDSSEAAVEEMKPKRQQDVNEEKTLFIRNLSFETTKETLAKTFSQFGEIHYAVICVNKDTDYSKGSGFVKFRNRDDAQKCLEAASQLPTEGSGGGIVLDGQTLLVSLAMSKEDLQRAAQEKQKKQKDNRNLYLAREGLIRPGTKAAEDVSKQDLSKRIQLEVWKQRMLKNYHIFVAKTRLCVRNLPINITDSKFKKLFLEAAGLGAEITEARVMRDVRKLTTKGDQSSKGYGFVKFTTHEHALKALRNTNNNPNIFTANARPIVEFSLENRAALNAKQKRLEKSRQNNKTSQKAASTDADSSSHRGRREETAGGEDMSFSGVKSNPNSKKLPSHVGPKIRHKKRNKNEFGKSKITRRKLRRDDQKLKKNNRNQKWEKKKGKKTLKADRNDTNFDTMVTRHKRKQTFGMDTEGKRKKWFHND